MSTQLEQSFTLVKRGKIWYYRFYIPEAKKYTSGLSTGETDKKKALGYVYNILNGTKTQQPRAKKQIQYSQIQGLIQEAQLSEEQANTLIRVLKDRIKNTPSLVEFITKFWTYEDSPYVKEKLSYGHSLSKRHCFESLKRVKVWTEFFGNSMNLGEVTRDELKDFQMFLRSKGLAQSTCNKIFLVGSTAMKWAADNKLIPVNPADTLRKFSQADSAKKGAFTLDQAQKIINSPYWNDERKRVGFLVAFTTGLRAGEISGLTPDCILEDRLIVRGTWGIKDGLKTPKNGTTREAPLLPHVKDELEKLIELNPWTQKKGEQDEIQGKFLFWGMTADVPMLPAQLNHGLSDCYSKTFATEQSPKAIEKTYQQMKGEGLSFHSTRHAYAAYLADRVDLRTVQMATGHKTAAMAEHYSNHANEKHFQDLLRATAAAVENVIPFEAPKRKEA